MKKPLKIVFLLEGWKVPSSRFRVLQYLPLLKEQGITPIPLTTTPSKYLIPLPRTLPRILRPIWLAPQLMWLVLIRLLQILLFIPQADVIVLQRDLLRVRSPFLERFLLLFSRGKRIVFDVDDAIYLEKDGSQGGRQERKIRFIAQHTAAVIAGNQHLAAQECLHGRVVVIPTVIDGDRYQRINRRQPNTVLTIGWTGVSSGLSYLTPLEPVLLALIEKFSYRFLIITNSGAVSPFRDPRIPCQMIPWRESTELEDLLQFDIGVMPLRDDRWARGKCGLKLIQYMALGIASVASPVGVNSTIIEHGLDGFLCSSSTDWETALTRLLTSPTLRETFAVAARAKIHAHYTIEATFPLWLDTLVNGEVIVPSQVYD